jgi:hypothetical protein
MATSERVILPQTPHFKMDKDAIVDLLDKFDAGIVGEEANGSFRVAFTRCCEMVGDLVSQLQEMGLDIGFPAIVQGNGFMHLTITPLEECESVPHELLSEFKWLPNKMGHYTFSKSAMHGIRLRQLFLQLESNFTPRLLEDDPGTDRVFLHVARRDLERSPAPSEEKATTKSSGPTTILLQSAVGALKVMLLLVSLLAFYERVFGRIDLSAWE